MSVVGLIRHWTCGAPRSVSAPNPIGIETVIFWVTVKAQVPFSMPGHGVPIVIVGWPLQVVVVAPWTTKGATDTGKQILAGHSIILLQFLLIGVDINYPPFIVGHS